jgi:ribonuclease Z
VCFVFVPAKLASRLAANGRITTTTAHGPVRCSRVVLPLPLPLPRISSGHRTFHSTRAPRAFTSFASQSVVASPRVVRPSKSRTELLTSNSHSHEQSAEHEAREKTETEIEAGPRRSAHFGRSMHSTLEFVTTPTADTAGTTIIVRSQTKHYVFGSQAEGLQRAVVQQGTRLLRVKDFFLTGRTEWKNVGGMAGMMLTMADATATSYANSMVIWEKAKERGRRIDPPQKPRFNIYGPPNLNHLFGTCRRFIFRKGVPIVATEYTAKTASLPSSSPSSSSNGNKPEGAYPPVFDDDFLQVWALPVLPKSNPTDPLADAELEGEILQWDLDYNTFEAHQAPPNETPEERHARHLRIRRDTVKLMFDSSWTFDTLVERHLSEVETPAPPLFVRKVDGQGFEPYTGPRPGGSARLPDLNVWMRTPWPGARYMSLPPTRPALESISYIVRTHGFRGSFDVKRAKELRVKPGPDYGKLTNGQSVQNADGEIVTPEQVLGPEKPGRGFAMLDVPSVDYLEALVQRDEFKAPDLMKGIEAFIWSLGPDVAAHPILTEFINKFDHVKHIISSADVSPNRISFDSVAAQTTKLAQIDPVRYRVPHYDLTSLPQKQLSEADQPQQTFDLPKNTIIADRGLSATLMPNFDLKPESKQAPFRPERIREEIIPEVLHLAEIAQRAVQDAQNDFEPWRALLDHPDTEITTLGTGSALPSKYRNVSATLVRVPGVGNYLFDAGENTMGQLQRVFAPEELTKILKDLRVIWISHLHADHHLGTAAVIKAWYRIRHNSKPNASHPDAATVARNTNEFGLSVISHDGMLQWLREYSGIEDFGYSRILPLEIAPAVFGRSGSYLSINGKSPGPFQIAKHDYRALFGFADIQSVHVTHCHGAMAVSVTFPESKANPSVKPLKISYSGDCRPSRAFGTIGRDTTVLIHEATFDDELEGDARAKKHSTTSEALDVGAHMNAKAVVLTHFSQRYQKIPVLQPVQDGETLPEEETLPATEDADAEADDVDPMTDAEAHPAMPQPPRLVQDASENKRVIKVRNKDMKVAVAFDYMRVKLKDIIEMEKYNEALNELLVKEVAEEEGEGMELNANGKRMSEDDAEENDKGKKQQKRKKEKTKSQRNN